MKTLILLCTLLATTQAETVEIETEYPIIHPSSTELPSSSTPKDKSEEPLEIGEFPTVKPLVLGKEGGISMNYNPEHRQEDFGPELILNEHTTGKPDKQANSSSAPKPGSPTVPLEHDNAVPNYDEDLDKKLEKVNQLINAYLREVLGKLGPIMKTGKPGIGMPVLEPLYLEDRDLSPVIGNEIFDIKMKKIKFCGISDFKVNSVETHIKDMRVKIGLHIPVIVGESDFSANGTIFDVFQVSGHGNASLAFKNIYARTTVYLNMEDGKLVVDSADQPYVDFQDADVKFLNSERASRKLREYGMYGQIAPILFWMFSGDIVDEMDQHLAAYLNDAFRKFDTPEILKEAVFNIRLLRVHVPRNPLPYAYINPSYFHAVHRFH